MSRFTIKAVPGWIIPYLTQHVNDSLETKERVRELVSYTRDLTFRSGIIRAEYQRRRGNVSRSTRIEGEEINSQITALVDAVTAIATRQILRGRLPKVLATLTEQFL